MGSLDISAYHTSAKPLEVRIDDARSHANPKTFKSGGVGWYANFKCQVLVGEQYYDVQCSVIITVTNSKKLACPETALAGPTTADHDSGTPAALYERSGLEEVAAGREMASPSPEPETEVNHKPKVRRKRRSQVP